MKHILFYCLLILSLSSCHSCRTENTTPSALPPATDTGANTFGCMVDNRVFLPHGPLFSGVPTHSASYTDYGNGHGYLGMYATNDKDDLRLSLQLDSIELAASSGYSLGQHLSHISLEKEGKTYIARAAGAPGTLFIQRYDSATRILAGTFWFDGIDTLSGTRITVSMGRFDMRLR